MIKVSVSGGFHNVNKINLHIDMYITQHQLKRLERHMCGITDCKCSGGWIVEGMPKEKFTELVQNAQCIGV